MLRIILSVVAICLLAPVLSYLTGWIVIGHDTSQTGTVGDIQLHGFPIWFLETAPGYSIVDGWHPDRLGINTLIWAMILAGLIWGFFRGRNRPTTAP